MLLTKYNAAMPTETYPDVDYTWHGTFYNHIKTSVKISSFYLHFLMSKGCHVQTGTHTHNFFYYVDVDS
jgi:hypothetical protein